MSEHAPAPTAWPFALALGVTLAGAGIITSPILIAAGALLALVALGAWVLEMAAEQERSR